MLEPGVPVCAPSVPLRNRFLRLCNTSRLFNSSLSAETNKRSREKHYYRLVTLFYYFCLAIISFRILRQVPFFPRDAQQVERVENGTVSTNWVRSTRTYFTMDVAICFFLFQARLLPKEIYSPVPRLDHSRPLLRSWTPHIGAKVIRIV